MFCIKMFVFLVLVKSSHCSAQRRIKDGQALPKDINKNYMVYLTKAKNSPQTYDAWICGGAIVSPSWIITSAACVEDIQFMYAISGYNKYVKFDKIDEDSCTKNSKKKVVETCVPKKYEFDYEKLEKWSYIDIAAVRVESPFDFTTKADESCTWIPGKIRVNYDGARQVPGTNSMVLGWGHTEKWRQPDDTKDYNQEFLHYAATMIIDKEKCKTRYKDFTNMPSIVDEFMICSDGAGNIDAKGDQIKPVVPTNTEDGCSKQGGALRCNENVMGLYNAGDRVVMSFDDMTLNIRRTEFPNGTVVLTRKHGICQNDHGGPLVTWFGAHELLLGVASVFRINSDSKCEGPFLYTSTQCNGAFLFCILSPDLPNEGKGAKRKSASRRTNVCDLPPAERGFVIERRTISWLNHPDGAALNEITPTQSDVTETAESTVATEIQTEDIDIPRNVEVDQDVPEFIEDVFMRPQIPLNTFNKAIK